VTTINPDDTKMDKFDNFALYHKNEPKTEEVKSLGTCMFLLKRDTRSRRVGERREGG